MTMSLKFDRISDFLLMILVCILLYKNPDAAAEILITDLNKISKWAKSWLVKFNPNKNESLIISRKKKCHHHILQPVQSIEGRTNKVHSRTIHLQ